MAFGSLSTAPNENVKLSVVFSDKWTITCGLENGLLPREGLLFLWDFDGFFDTWTCSGAG
jgi:hypothetical protein